MGRATRGLLGLLGAFLVTCLLYSWFVPPWEAPDESEHVQYVHHVARHWSAPSRLPTIQPDHDESHQPPLYYFLAAALAGRAYPDRLDIRLNPYVTWPGHSARLAVAAHSPLDEGWPPAPSVAATHLTRLISTALGAITIACAYFLAQAVSGRSHLALAAAASIALLPGFVFSSSTVSNDSAVTAFSAVAAVLALGAGPRPELGWARLGLLSVALALAAAAKLSGLVVAAAAAASLALARVRPLQIGVAVLPASGLAVVWALSRGFDPILLGRHDPGGPIETTLVPSGLARLLNFGRTAIGAFGWQNVFLPDPVYLLVAILLIPPAAGLARARTRRLTASLLVWPALLASAVLANALTSHPAAFLEHGRLFYPALAAAAAALALGWANLPPLLGRLSAAALPGALALTTWLALPLVLLPAYSYRADISGFAARSVAPDVLLRHFEPSPGLQLAGFDLSPSCPRPGNVVRAVLYWTPTTGGLPGLDTAIVLESEHWPRTGLSQRDPGRGLYPTSLWRAGEYVRDDHEFWLATDLPDGRYTVRVGIVPWLQPGGEPRVWGRVDLARAETLPLLAMDWDRSRGDPLCWLLAPAQAGGSSPPGA